MFEQNELKTAFLTIDNWNFARRNVGLDFLY